MSSRTIARFEVIEELLRADDYEAAESALDAIDVSVLDGAESAYHSVLKCELGLYTGDYNENRVHAAIEALRFSDRSDLFGRVKLIAGWQESALGRFQTAQEHLLEAYASFVRCGDRQSSARSRNRLAYVQLKTGNTAAATANLRSCIQIYSELNQGESATSVAHNLAYVYYSVGSLGEALELYRDYGFGSECHGKKPAMNSFIMSALPHALLGDIKTARQTIAKAEPFLDSYPRERAIYFENFGLINILDGQYAVAEKALTQGLDISLEIAPESALVSQIKRLFGDLYVAIEKWDLAEQFTREGLEVAEKIGERVEIGACWRIMAQIEQHKGNNDKAREWYRQAIDMMNLIGARYELAVTRYLAGVSGLYSNGERTALLYLAREYFDSEKVMPYIKKIDKALTSAQSLPKAIKGSGAPPEIVTVNPAMKKLVTYAENISQSDMTVLLTGATGTGKDLFARFIHHCSGRSGEFVSVNAAAIPNEMIEAELFGHAKGAFTSAIAHRVGLIEQADGGTLYLNEIADATPEFQAKLLEVVQTRLIRRLGENKTRPVAFRLIAATNHDLQQRMKDNLFRLDLYHRLNDIPIKLPSLCDRTEDFPALVECFLTESGCKSVSNGGAVQLMRLCRQFVRCAWTGNVRQLQAETKRLWLTSGHDLDRMIELAGELSHDRECEHLASVLDDTGWNRSETARILGVSEGAVRKRIRKHGLAES